MPLRMDNAYTAELYTAWVALSARGPSVDPTFTFRSTSWHFSDCKGYITAQEGRPEPDDSLQGDLIRECRALVGGRLLPRHLYSHITGTWLDVLLDQVDAAAGRSGTSSPTTMGWLSQEPRICFSHAGLQVHDALPQARRALFVSHHASAQSPPPQRNLVLGDYTIAVSHGLLSWSDHLTVTGLRLSLTPPPETRLALSASYPTLATTSYPAHLTLYSAPTTIGRLAARLSQRCHAWRHCVLKAWGVLILWGNKPFLLAVDGSLAHETLPPYTIGRLGAISPPHRDALRHQGLRPADLRRLLCDVVLTTVLQHKRDAVPVLPLADHYSPQKGDPVGKCLVNNPPSEWYHATNWSPTPGATRWPAWDGILSIWLSGDLLLAPEVKSTITTRILYVYLKSNRMPPSIREEINLEAHDVVILDSLGRHGLTPPFPDRRRLWAIHYGGEGRSLEAGLCGVLGQCAMGGEAFGFPNAPHHQGGGCVGGLP